MLAIFIVITLIFTLAVLARNKLNLRICAMCVSIAITWLGLLLLYKLSRFHDPILLAILMGQSISGLFYTLKDRVPKELRIFTLPFFLTLTAIFYALVTSKLVVPAFVLLAVLWTAGWLIFTSRNDPGKKDLANATMDCCGGEK